MRWRTSAEWAGVPVPSVPYVGTHGTSPRPTLNSPRYYPEGRDHHTLVSLLGRRARSDTPSGRGEDETPAPGSMAEAGRRARARACLWYRGCASLALRPRPPPPLWTATRRRWRRSWKVRVPRLGERGLPAPGAAAGAMGTRGSGGGRSWAPGVGRQRMTSAGLCNGRAGAAHVAEFGRRRGRGGSRGRADAGTGRTLWVPSAADCSGHSGKLWTPDAGMAAAQLLLSKITHDRGFLPLLCPRAGGGLQPALPGQCGRCPVLPPAAEGHGDARPWGEPRRPGLQSHTCKWRREKKE